MRRTALALALALLLGAEPFELRPGYPVRVQVGGKVMRIELEGAPADSDLKARLAAAYAKSTEAKNREYAASLVELYRWAADDAKRGGTAKEFRSRLGKRSVELLPPDVLLPVREEAKKSMAAALPSKPEERIDPERASACFSRLADALESVAR